MTSRNDFTLNVNANVLKFNTAQDLYDYLKNLSFSDPQIAELTVDGGSLTVDGLTYSADLPAFNRA